jgi:hypothetical protein
MKTQQAWAHYVFHEAVTTHSARGGLVKIRHFGLGLALARYLSSFSTKKLAFWGVGYFSGFGPM